MSTAVNMDAKLYASFFLISLVICSCKNQRNCCEKNLKCLKDTHFIDTRKHWDAETAQYRLEIIFNTIPFIQQLRYYLVRKNKELSLF